MQLEIRHAIIEGRTPTIQTQPKLALYTHVEIRFATGVFCPFNVIRKRNLSVAKTRESTIPLGGVQKLTTVGQRQKRLSTREERVSPFNRGP